MPRHNDPMAVIRADAASESSSASEDAALDTLRQLPLRARRVAYATKAITADYRALHRAFIAEVAGKEREWLAEDREYFARRAALAAGIAAVSEADRRAVEERTSAESHVEEIPSSSSESGERGTQKKKKRVTVVPPDAAEEAKHPGIPKFWLTAMRNHDTLEGMVKDRDEDALRHLRDVELAYVDDDPRKGFVLRFHFDANEYFRNEVLEKRYIMEEDEDEEDQTLDRVEGCTIDWTSPEKNLTVVMKQKKQRHKTGKVRVVTREEKVPSFFHFFTAPEKPDEDKEAEDEDEDLSYEEQLEMDYEAGIAFAQQVIPRAAYYASGKSVDDIAAQFPFPHGDEEDEEGEGDDDDDNDDDESEEENAKPAGRGGRGGAGGAKKGGAPSRGRGKGQAECPQQ